MKWTDSICQDIITYMRDTSSATYSMAADKVSTDFGEYVHPEQLRSALRRYATRTRPMELIVAEDTTHNPIFPEMELATVGIPEPIRSFDEPCLMLESDSWLTLADIHAPYQNKEMIERAIQVTRGRFPHITDCVIAGDLFNFERISRFGESGPSNNTSADIRAGGAILRSLLEHFNVWVFPGNHDLRLAKRIGSEYDFEFVINGAVGNIRSNHDLHISNLGYMRANNNQWMILHPTSYSKFGGKTPSEIAELEQCNVIGSHNHVQGMMLTPSGKFLGIDPGHLTEPDLHWYQHQNITKHARWSAGFLIVSRNYPYLFGDLMTDWSLWL